jgi:guanosine-3',5'-bis(diphosphate) 3'-pyrophosphohydrolase
MGTLERVIAIAAEAHDGQVDKASAPYILHPLRLMRNLSTSDERIVAVLHDF